MKISSNFNRFYWKVFIADIKQNLKELRWNNIDLNITRLNEQGVHDLLKIVTFHNKSLTEMENKEVVEFLEDIRVLLSDNGYTLQIDNEEWERIIKEIR